MVANDDIGTGVIAGKPVAEGAGGNFRKMQKATREYLSASGLRKTQRHVPSPAEMRRTILHLRAATLFTGKLHFHREMADVKL